MAKKSPKNNNLPPQSAAGANVRTISESDARFAVTMLLETRQVESRLGRYMMAQTTKDCRYKTVRGLAKHHFPDLTSADITWILDLLGEELHHRTHTFTDPHTGYGVMRNLDGDLIYPQRYDEEDIGAEGREL